MWTPHSVRGDESATLLTGPIGDRLIVRFAGDVPGYDGCTWVGQVRKALDGVTVAEFTFVDLSTEDAMDLTIIIEDTTAFDPDCTYLWDVRASSGDPAPTTPLHGTLIGRRAVTDLSPPPAITGLILSTGTTAGGDTVSVTGSNFVDVISIEFDGIAAPAFMDLAPTLIVVETPAHAAGDVDVVVITANGTSLPATFTYE